MSPLLETVSFICDMLPLKFFSSVLSCVSTVPQYALNLASKLSLIWLITNCTWSSCTTFCGHFKQLVHVKLVAGFFWVRRWLSVVAFAHSVCKICINFRPMIDSCDFLKPFLQRLHATLMKLVHCFKDRKENSAK